jgi:hypothetical protein
LGSAAGDSEHREHAFGFERRLGVGRRRTDGQPTLDR